MYRVLLIEDHTIVSESLAQLLSRHGDFEDAKCVETIREAFALLDNENFDIVVVDIGLGENVPSGLDFLKQMKGKKKIPIVVFSMRTEPDIIGEALDLGASGFIDKASHGEDFIRGLMTVINGDSFYSKSVNKIIQGKFKHGLKNIESAYSTIELKVIELIAKEHTVKEIAEKLNRSKGTIENTKTGLINKMGVRNTVGLIIKAIKEGLIKMK